MPESAIVSLAQIDADAAGPGAAAQLFAFLVLQLVEMTLAGERVADVADVVGRHAALARQEGAPGSRPGRRRWAR